jgi:hypothetical protein
MINKISNSGKIYISFVISAIIFAGVFYFITPYFFPLNFELIKGDTSSTTETVKKDDGIKVVHIKTPIPVKAIYMTACVAATPSIREGLANIARNTEINSILIDIKDYTGTISFTPEGAKFADNGGKGCKSSDLKEFINELHKDNIYVIGRISTFQDHFLVGKKPDSAVKRKSDGAIWKDYKGISWFDAGSKEIWDYVVDLAKESYAIGFDEINFDYIRFPSDGNMKDIYYPFSEGKIKTEVMNEFYSYLHENLKDLGVPISGDVFGMTTTNYDDLNIGQILESALKYFDYVAPMVYPSHYPSGFINLANPADNPYEVIKYSMDIAVGRAIVASSTPNKLRPWLQDFDLGADYDAVKVRAQMQATYDSGLDSWMMWNASNKYTTSAFKIK